MDNVPMPKLLGPTIINLFRNGYHPEMNKGADFFNNIEGEDPIYINGNRVSIECALHGIFVEPNRWEVIFTDGNGTCTRFDVLHKETKMTYSNTSTYMNIWNKCWIVNSPGLDGHVSTSLINSTNGRFPNGGFCAWDFDTTELHSTVIHKDTLANYTEKANNCYHWHAIAGRIISYSNSLSKTIRLFDIRDGERRLSFTANSGINAMTYSTPMNWMNDNMIVLAHEQTISLWEVEAQRSIPFVMLPTINGRIKAMDVQSSNTESRREKRTRFVQFDGVYCTHNVTHIMDKRAKMATSFKMPLAIEMINSVFCNEDTILLGCTVVESSGQKRTIDKVLQLSMKSNKKITSYTIPEPSNSGFDTRISQVWADRKYILALTSTSLYVFDQYVWDEQRPPLISDNTVIRIRSIIGPYDFANASFDAFNERVMLTSTSHSPIWCSL